MREKYDAIVIGAGIIGSSCAAELAKENLRVLVVDAGYAGCGTTSATMGHVVVMDDSEAQLQLSLLSRRLWLELARDYPVESDYLPCGTLWVAADEEEMEVVRRKAHKYIDYHVATEVLDDKSLYEWEPNLRKGMVGGLRVIDDCSVYPATSSKLFLRGLELREQSQVREIGDNTVVLEDGSELEADFIVNATGAKAAELTPGLPIEPRKGHLLITERYPGFCKHQVLELGYLKSAHKMEKESVAFNIHPRLSGQYILGSSREFVGWNDDVNRRILRSMINRAFEYMPALAKLTVLRSWVGFRPASPDKLPYIGKWPKVKGLYIAAGHEGLGITTSLGTAKLLAADILGKKPPIDPEPYRPARLLKKANT